MSSVEALVQAARQSNTQALGELTERYRGYLICYVDQRLRSHLRRRYDAADIAQDVLVRALHGFGNFQGTTEHEFSAWIRTILHNQLTDLCRKKQIPLAAVALPAANEETSVAWDPAASSTSPSRQVARGERALLLCAAVQRLPEKERLAVQMRHLEGLSLDAICEQLECSYQAAAKHIHHGLKRLRAELNANVSESISREAR
jgi:RNA polymerase sigma-70 factor (ECF subfamily)